MQTFAGQLTPFYYARVPQLYQIIHRFGEMKNFIIPSMLIVAGKTL
jgi:hypothetical protein